MAWDVAQAALHTGAALTAFAGLCLVMALSNKTRISIEESLASEKPGVVIAFTIICTLILQFCIGGFIGDDPTVGFFSFLSLTVVVCLAARRLVGLF